MELLNDFSTTVRKALKEIDPDYEKYDGLVICGTHSPHDVETYIAKIKEARETGRPYLGICFGHQVAAIEYARNVLGIEDATSEEFGRGTFVVKKRMGGLKIGWMEGETWWNNYEVDLPQWERPSHFITTQAHPEYQSSKDAPHPLLKRFIQLCKNGNADGRQHLGL